MSKSFGQLYEFASASGNNSNIENSVFYATSDAEPNSENLFQEEQNTASPNTEEHLPNHLKVLLPHNVAVNTFECGILDNETLNILNVISFTHDKAQCPTSGEHQADDKKKIKIKVIYTAKGKNNSHPASTTTDSSNQTPVVATLAQNDNTQIESNTNSFLNSYLRCIQPNLFPHQSPIDDPRTFTEWKTFYESKRTIEAIVHQHHSFIKEKDTLTGLCKFMYNKAAFMEDVNKSFLIHYGLVIEFKVKLPCIARKLITSEESTAKIKNARTEYLKKFVQKLENEFKKILLPIEREYLGSLDSKLNEMLTHAKQEYTESLDIKEAKLEAILEKMFRNRILQLKKYTLRNIEQEFIIKKKLQRKMEQVNRMKQEMFEAEGEESETIPVDSVEDYTTLDPFDPHMNMVGNNANNFTPTERYTSKSSTVRNFSKITDKIANKKKSKVVPVDNNITYSTKLKSNKPNSSILKRKIDSSFHSNEDYPRNKISKMFQDYENVTSDSWEPCESNSDEESYTNNNSQLLLDVSLQPKDNNCNDLVYVGTISPENNSVQNIGKKILKFNKSYRIVELLQKYEV